MKKEVLKKCLSTSMALILSSCCFFSGNTYVKDSVYINTCAITDAQQEFINNLGYAAQKNYSKYKILSSMTVAQAILESNWEKVLYQSFIIISLA